MEKKKTNRGFTRYEFKDQFRQECSLQKSSLATGDCIWLGVDTDLEGNEVHCRMHLTRNQINKILPILEKFVKTGEI